jgi:hypothetical protein
MQVLTNLNTVITLLQQSAVKIGLTVAGLFVAISCIRIIMDNDTSPAARAERWVKLKTVFIFAVIIAATSVFIQFAVNIGSML